MAERAYVRVYFQIKDDPKFDAIRDDDHHLATWLRLLMTADANWPASADLPASARSASVQALVDAGLVALLPGHRFRITGMDAERMRRHERAQTASSARWNASSNAYSNADSNATRARGRTEPNLTEPSTRIFDRMVERRVAHFKESGKWDPEWGPEPTTND